MEFWRWYWLGVKKAITLRWIRHPSAEYMLGAVVTLGLAITLSSEFTPLWLILVIPLGGTLIVHAWWRWNRQ